jgi:hypothetical protein
MKRFALVAVLLIVGCGSGGGDSNSSGDLPHVAGSYELTNSNPALCEAVFDSNITVKQDGEDIIIEAVHSGYSDATGTIDNDGNVSATTTNDTQCEGQFVSGSCVITCTFTDGGTCDLTYDKV